MKRIACLLLLCSILLAACTNEITFKGNDDEAQLILNTFLDTALAENSITVAFTGRDEISYARNATVNIYVNGELKDNIRGASSPNGIYTTGVTFAPGDVIKVEALTQNPKYHAWAEVEVPHPIDIDGVTVSSFSTKFHNYYKAKTTFTENSGERRYYRISAKRIIETQGTSVFTGNDTVAVTVYPQYLIAREDVVLTDGRPTSIEKENDDIVLDPADNIYCVFDNSRLNGKYTMLTSFAKSVSYQSGQVEVPEIFERITVKKDHVRIKLSAISHGMYLYLNALNMYDSENYDEMLSQPIKFFSNVNGGTGIVGVMCGYAEDVFLHEYQDEDITYTNKSR